MKENEAIKLHISENIHRIEVIEDFLMTNSDANDKECRKNIDILTKINKALEEVQKCRAIGKPEECRAAVEKQTAKRPRIIGNAMICPSCPRCFKSASPTYCPSCGQMIDWGNEE